MSGDTYREVLAAARLLFRPGDVIELRVPNTERQGTISGYFDDLEKLAQAVASLERARHPGVYWTLNPVTHDLLARAVNRIRIRARSGETTGDHHIVCRRWLPFDLDPERPAGISSTDIEHQAALASAMDVCEALRGEGWPEPIYADSGNGGHLLYAIDLPNDADAKDLLSAILHAAAHRFNGDARGHLVKVDLTVDTAARIFKTYGTTARKGDHTAERPHRLSQILSAPDSIHTVPLELLQRLAAQAPQKAKPRPAASHSYGGYSGPAADFDVRAWLDRHGIRYRPPVNWDGGRKFVLEECPFDPSHKAPDSAVFERSDGYGFKCFHNSCHGRDWRELRELFEGPRPVRQAPRPSPVSAPPPAPPDPPELLDAPPENPSGDSDVLPLAAADVEAAVNAAIASGEMEAALRLAPEIARTAPHVQALIVGKLRKAFGRAFPSREFARGLKELAAAAAAPAGDGDDLPDETPDLTGYPLTDAGNGDRIIALYGEDLRFCTEYDKWLYWDGCRWCVDEAEQVTLKVEAMARLLYRQAAKLQDSELREAVRAHARRSENQRAIKNALDRAAARLPISALALDQNHYLLNCLNGVLDVRHGELLPFSRSFLITKLCHFKYDPKAKCPRFLQFINWTMGESPDDAEERESVTRLVAFLQKAFGLALTGDASEKALFIFFGKKGNNGKTTLLGIFAKILTEYSTQIDVNTLLNAKATDNNIRADLAKLKGARFAVTTEIDDQQRVSERLIKQLTAGLGGKVTACRKFENPIEFDPTHHIFMDSNYLPKMQGQDKALWSRLKCIPFNQRIEDDDPSIDKDLGRKLVEGEGEGILAWAVRGAMQWWKDRRLGDPPEVRDATEEWRENDDPLKQFLEDCCEAGVPEEGYWVRASQLSSAYHQWCKDNSEKYPLGRGQFSERLGLKGFRQNRSRRDEYGKQMRSWEGLRLQEGVTLAEDGKGRYTREPASF